MERLPDSNSNSCFATVLGVDRHHVFEGRVAREQFKFAFARVWGDRDHVFNERVDFQKTPDILPGGIE